MIMLTVCKVIIPVLYSLFIGIAYGCVFKRKFGHSLMLAYCTQIIFLLLSGMIFKNLLVGIVFEAVLTVAGYGYAVRRDGRDFVSMIGGALADRSVAAFIVLAFTVFVINYGKHYVEWDEFSHWGRFLEECCRTNQLYVMSTASMAHKDYVPAVTLFEYLWCKLSLSYSEANGYRGIQMLLVAIVLFVTDEVHVAGTRFYRAAMYFLSNIALMGIPLLFATFQFYHSIYEDAILGILMFYAIWIAIHDGESWKYRQGMLTLALTVLIMCKMTALPFAFLIWLFCIWNEGKKENTSRAQWGLRLLSIVIPMAIWYMFNQFVTRYISTSGTQSYGGFNVTTILNVLLHDGSVSWQMDVEKSFIKALFSQGLVGNASFVVIAFTSILVVGICSGYNSKETDLPYQKTKTGRQLLAWMIVSTVAYALMMCFLYDIAFSEYEARQLASFDRYMSSWLIAIVYLSAAICFVRYAGQKQIQQGVIVTILSFITVTGNYEQLLSGLTGEEAEQLYEGEANLINEVVHDDESILIVDRGSNGWKTTVIGYYCLPIQVDFLSPGPSEHDGDEWSTDMSLKELETTIQAYDYVYFFNVDDVFIDRYGELAPELTVNTGEILYSVESDGRLVHVGK